MKAVIILLAAMVVVGSFADTFGTGGNQFSIDFVDIGYAGNAAQSAANRSHTRSGGDGYGAVNYEYRIGQTEVTIEQFTKARAADSRIGNGNEDYWNDGTRTVGIEGPASSVTWYECAKFANWLTTGDAYTGAYQFNGSGTLTGVDRTAAVAAHGTVYVLPTEDEWYKAAYYKPVDDGSYSLYADGTDTVPTWGTANGWNYRNGSAQYVNGLPNFQWETGFGGVEQNGTYDMMGNVFEWNESAWDGTLDNMSEARVRRGGSAAHIEGANSLRSSYRNISGPTGEGSAIGFRIAAIPEPSTVSLMGLGAVATVFARRHKNKRGNEIKPKIKANPLLDSFADYD